MSSWFFPASYSRGIVFALMALAPACRPPLGASSAETTAPAGEDSQKLSPSPASPTEAAEAKAFFEQYQSLSLAYDPQLADLYLDTAAISTTRHDGDVVKEVTLTGAQWKQLLVPSLPLAQEKGDRDRFDNVAFETVGDAIRISADRYSYLKCRTDPDYVMEVEQDTAGSLRIVKERTTTWASSVCGTGPNKSLEQRMDEIAEQIATTLPRSLDDDTRLDRLTHDGKTLTYGYTIVSATAEEIDPNNFAELMRPATLQQLCNPSSPLRPILDDGGAIRFEYAGSAGNSIVNLEAVATDCPP